MTRPRRERRRDLIWGLAFLAGSIPVAAVGQPQPLAILAAGAGAVTGSILAARSFD